MKSGLIFTRILERLRDVSGEKPRTFESGEDEEEIFEELTL